MGCKYDLDLGASRTKVLMTALKIMIDKAFSH
ncbi:uncharacterized protein G2W53_042399 [Senna tora]|uniref:Uncharacterized protein n=1 Tax=Senna tora TaxID=362788 RepID=A0A834SFY5_9FABA|nr:uncharacterized protein G2W53_042399 [Senna tora]